MPTVNSPCYAQKTVVIISILMQGVNQHCNALQSTMGIFLHSCSAPEKVIQVLGHMGISIAQKTIHRAIKSLSLRSTHAIITLGQSRLASVAFDNFDIKFRTLISTVNSPGEGMVHLTSATLLKLNHGVTHKDLLCSDLIWNRQDIKLNPKATDPRQYDPLQAFNMICSLHPETYSDNELTQRGRFNAYYAKSVLFTHGPIAFRRHKDFLPDPEGIEMIPIVKLEQVLMAAMDQNVGSVAGTIGALEDIPCQMGIGDGPGCVEAEDYTQLTHCDLGLFEHILTAIKECSPEMTPQQRMQFALSLILGYFHMKMAAADATWRNLVHAIKLKKLDPTSFMTLVGVLRPNETGKLGSSPTFRQQHDCIRHVLIALILDAWRVEVARWLKGKYTTLEEFAASKPSPWDLNEIANRVAKEYIAGEGRYAEREDTYAERTRASAARDQQRENVKLMLQQLLLYEELSYAMNAGDIGRIETLYPAWIQIFFATGKHKYANRMLQYMHNLYNVYPAGLR